MHDLDQITYLVRPDDEVVYADAGYQGVERRADIVADEQLSQVEVAGRCPQRCPEDGVHTRPGSRVP